LKTERVIATWIKGIARSSTNCIIYCVQFGDGVKESAIVGACRTLGKDEKNRQEFICKV